MLPSLCIWTRIIHRPRWSIALISITNDQRASSIDSQLRLIVLVNLWIISARNVRHGTPHEKRIARVFRQCWGEMRERGAVRVNSSDYKVIWEYHTVYPRVLLVNLKILSTVNCSNLFSSRNIIYVYFHSKFNLYQHSFAEYISSIQEIDEFNICLIHL